MMRKQRSGHVVTITSTAGIVGGETASTYAASKFGAEGWMEALTPEVAPFGIKTTLVEPTRHDTREQGASILLGQSFEP